MDLNHHIGLICASIAQLDKGADRSIVAIAGPPASGKSTLGKGLVDAINCSPDTELKSTLLPMDGFHLDNSLLKTRGLLCRKGAPETFDSDGFCMLISRLQDRSAEIFYPVFDRSQDLAIAGAGVIEPDTDVVVVEGNYLLMRTTPWCSMHAIYDLTVFTSPSIHVLEERLVERWLAHGYDREGACRKVHENDLPNARTVLEQSVPGEIRIPDQPDHSSQFKGGR